MPRRWRPPTRHDPPPLGQRLLAQLRLGWELWSRVGALVVGCFCTGLMVTGAKVCGFSSTSGCRAIWGAIYLTLALLTAALFTMPALGEYFNGRVTRARLVQYGIFIVLFSLSMWTWAWSRLG